jgi:hypothetical protein
MPRKAKKRAAKPTQIHFVAEVTESTAQYYANFAAVAQTSYDFSITFSKVPAQPTSDQIASANAGNPVKIEPLVQIVFPVKLIQGIIDALTKQKERYEQHFGVIDPVPK